MLFNCCTACGHRRFVYHSPSLDRWSEPCNWDLLANIGDTKAKCASCGQPLERMKIRALTVSQPFADLLASGEKWVENRTRKLNLFGPLAIHAGKGIQYLSRDELQRYAHGCFVGAGIASGCYSFREIHANAESKPDEFIPRTSKTWGELATHKHVEGPFCILIENAIPIKPVDAKGSQGVWFYESDKWFEPLESVV